MMRYLKLSVRFFWYVYQLVLIFDQVKCGTKRELFECISVHLCECDLHDEYKRCYLLGPIEAQNKSLSLMNELLSGEYTLEDTFSPLSKEICSGGDKAFEHFLRWEGELRKYEKEVRGDPLRVNEQMPMHNAKNCFMPYMAKCMEFGNQCG